MGYRGIIYIYIKVMTCLVLEHRTGLLNWLGTIFFGIRLSLVGGLPTLIHMKKKHIFSYNLNKPWFLHIYDKPIS